MYGRADEILAFGSKLSLDQAMVSISPILLIPPRDVTSTSKRLVSQDHHLEGDLASSVQQGCRYHRQDGLGKVPMFD
jgi:hypothetical protein